MSGWRDDVIYPAIFNFQSNLRRYNDGMVEWWNGGMAEWQNGGMAEWWNGRIAEWQNGTIPNLPDIFTVHADNYDTDTF
jgi:hypothetical protein